MKFKALIGTSILAMSVASPAFAQDEADTQTDAFGGEIVVTAQRQSERLQDVPIAVSAFSAESLEAQQIENPSDLQLTLPNVTFTKTNFTSSSFTIRGIGDLCVGVSCDSATAIHQNESPLIGTRLFETEFFDLERIEVLRGPQGTLFGRNATSGVVNVVTAKPDLSGFGASGEFEYGNYNSIKAKGMVNLPIGDTLGVRIAGFYLNRDGYTKNLFDDSRIDDRDMYAIRGSIRWQPTDNTTLDLLGYYFREDDNRLRIQKQYCQRDPTGVLGCLNNRRDPGVTNGNSTFVGVLTSREFLAIRGIPTAFGLGSLYGPDSLSTFQPIADPRVVNTDFRPTYFSDELQLQGRLEHSFGAINVSLAGVYQEATVDSQQDYNLSVQDRSFYAPALGALNAAAAGQIPGLPASFFIPIRNALIPNGPTGDLCTSLSEETGLGAYGGFRTCGATPQDFDRSNQDSSSWSGELIISSDFDGPFNFLLGGIYGKSHLTENSYYVNAFGIDYLTGILGTFTSLGSGGTVPNGFLGTPFFRNNTDDLRVTSYGLFGEGYVEFNDSIKLTVGLRYNNDKKYVRARSTLASFLVPYATTGSAFNSPLVGGFDADPGIAGNQLFQERRVGFDEVTGRAVLDWKITPDNLIYVSYSRGYKSGGINPPLQPVFAVEESFAPEIVDAFEIGSKNRFGALQLNLTAFYYKYDSLQLSRIVARTSVNDSVDANIWGIEAEAVITPTPDFVVNLGASYLNTEVSSDKFLGNPRDPSGGRNDAVIIKDITNGANCAVVPTTAGNAAGTAGYVTAINANLGLRAPAGFGTGSGINSPGAFGICSVLEANAATVGALFGGIRIENAGVPVNIRGNKLPQAPNYKFSAGVQYTHNFQNDMSLTPRIDIAYTGDSYGNIFNGRINEINGYAQVNAQIQLNGPDKKWFVKAFVSNIFDSQPVTGLYVTDQSSGLFTNVFTLDPRRYGLAAGFKF
ncbi:MULTISPECIES: TonB-dependent receptor [unclassified Sphingopyxis]|uniref:TonB-dependent receptor n=1 Tax=unclassified Sphingopyxis TaxID=2614943 RepID=UPI000735E241|nr:MULTISPECIES: TonB-dependent receptor [unclassified Sphingopyxis]KTE32797.1 TonB-dependent receptor [Sphingopyxis sp. HIX]KTE84962.1 TonB-dependent receptor [Sphingopyxis sp. HXXIV]